MVLDLKEGPRLIECATVCVKCEVILIAIVVGLVGTTPIFMFYHEIRVFAGLPGSTIHTFVSRCFSIWFGFFNLYFWKGVYDLIWYYDDLHKIDHEDWEISVICLCIGFVGLGKDL